MIPYKQVASLGGIILNLKLFYLGVPWRNPRKGRDQILPSGNLGARGADFRSKDRISQPHIHPEGRMEGEGGKGKEGREREREKPLESENEEEMGSALSPAASVSPDPFSPFQLSSLKLAVWLSVWVGPLPFPLLAARTVNRTAGPACKTNNSQQTESRLPLLGSEQYRR